jgi:hypothetical protein
MKIMALLLCVAATAQAQTGEKSVTTHARGEFDVKLSPQSVADASLNGIFGRMTLDKQFHGDLEGTSKGEMLTAGSAVKNSAGYVAIERVSGTLQGRKGTFVLQHSGTMNRGAPQLIISVVPDTGTDELAGISGTMSLDISGGKHAYDLAYTLPEVK